MADHDKTDFISLTDAADHSPYSAEYLSLRARQGKLRAVKHGRNWVTTLGWLDDYLHQVDSSRAELKEATVKAVITGPDKEFEVVRDKLHLTKADSPAVGAIIDEESRVPSVSNFSWDDEEPEVKPNYKADQFFAGLRSRVDEAIELDGGFIELAKYDRPGIAAHERTDSYFELGLRGPDTHQTVSPKEYAAKSGASAKQDVFELFNAMAKPVATMAVVLVIVSSALLLDGPLQIHRNVATGFGVLFESFGNELIAAGELRELKSGKPGIMMPRPIALVDASEAVLASNNTSSGTSPRTSVNANSNISSGTGSGTVAGAYDANHDLGFWGTVALGIKTIFGQ